FSRRLRQRGIRLVENEARPRREIAPRRTEDVDQPGRALAHVLRGVNDAGGNYQHGRALIIFVLVLPSPRLVRRPGIAKVMDERALQRQRGLLEILMRM